MNFQFGQVALFMACLIGLIVFSVYSIRTARKSGIAGYLRGLLFAVGTTIVAMSKLITNLSAFWRQVLIHPRRREYRWGLSNWCL